MTDDTKHKPGNSSVKLLLLAALLLLVLPATKALYHASLHTYHPRKILHYEATGRYPERARPAMYICNPDMCTLPIENPEQVKAQASLFNGPASS